MTRSQSQPSGRGANALTAGLSIGDSAARALIAELRGYATVHRVGSIRIDMDDVRLILAVVDGSADLLDALKRSEEGWANAIELKIILPQHVNAACILRDEARAAIAKAQPQQTVGKED